MEFHGKIQGGRVGVEEAHVASFSKVGEMVTCCELKVRVEDPGERRKFERALERNVIASQPQNDQMVKSTVKAQLGLCDRT